MKLKPLHLLIAALAIGTLLILGTIRQGPSKAPGTNQPTKAAANGLTRERAIEVPLPPPHTPLSQVTAQLQGKALSGSPNAACRLARDINRCARIEDSLELAENLAPAASASPQLAAISKELLEQTEGNAEGCDIPSGRIDAYRFQQAAADAGIAKYQRWLVIAPSLDQQNFLDDLSSWQDYKARAKRYMEEALKRRSGSDLQLLLAVYAPEGARFFRPPYRIRDDVTFLALVAVARKNQIQVPLEIQQAVGQLEKELAPEEALVAKERERQLSDGWQFDSRPESMQEALVRFNEEDFCNLN